MENFYTPFSNTSTTTTTTTTTSTTMIREPNMGCVQNPHFFINEAIRFPSPNTNSSSNTQFYCISQYLPTHESLQIPYTYPIEQPGHSPASYPVYPFLQNEIQIGVPGSIQGSCFLQPNVSSKEQEKRSMDAYRTKVARIKRKLARQRSLSVNKNSSGSSSSVPSSTQVDGANTDGKNSKNNSNRDLYKFCTPDNKRLRVLLKKELKNSDVGSLGRIVLPKREAEENLPSLTDKEGIQVVIRNANSNQVWSLKFKYWSNNKSRMYVLENTGDFVKQNGLEIGDSLTLYEDESKNLYFSIKKVEKPVAEPLNKQHYANHNHNYLYTPISCQARDEEEASLALLIEQLKHKEQQEANDLMTLSLDGASSYRQAEEAKNDLLANFISKGTFTHLAAAAIQPSSSSNGNFGVVHDCQINVDDCYGNLDMLPE